jgi:hypothetical protein
MNKAGYYRSLANILISDKYNLELAYLWHLKYKKYRKLCMTQACGNFKSLGNI